MTNRILSVLVGGLALALTGCAALGLLVVGVLGGAAYGIAGVAGGGWVRPIDHGAAVTQLFGCTAYVFEPVSTSCPGGHFHSGIDLATASGTPVRATLAGIAFVRVTAFGYGLHLVVDHPNGVSSLYGHLSSVAVLDGEPVAAGEVIGAVGSTGNSTGPHLHFEIRRTGLPEDPALDMPFP